MRLLWEPEEYLRSSWHSQKSTRSCGVCDPGAEGPVSRYSEWMETGMSRKDYNKTRIEGEDDKRPQISGNILREKYWVRSKPCSTW